MRIAEFLLGWPSHGSVRLPNLGLENNGPQITGWSRLNLVSRTLETRPRFSNVLTIHGIKESVSSSRLLAPFFPSFFFSLFERGEGRINPRANKWVPFVPSPIDPLFFPSSSSSSFSFPSIRSLERRGDARCPKRERGGEGKKRFLVSLLLRVRLSFHTLLVFTARGGLTRSNADPPICFTLIEGEGGINDGLGVELYQPLLTSYEGSLSTQGGREGTAKMRGTAMGN